MAEAPPQTEAKEPDCRYCGEPVDPLEPGHYKSPSDKFAHADCVVDHCYDDREKVATNEGVFRIESVTIIKKGGGKEEVHDSYWQADCPVCYQAHEAEDHSEDIRTEFIDEVCECCGAEWMPPADYIEDCEVCGADHRESRECRPVAHREPFPGVEEEYERVDCDWNGHGTELQGPTGECPECDSRSVQVVEE